LGLLRSPSGMNPLTTGSVDTGKHFHALSGVLRLEKNRKQLGLGFDPQLAVHVFLMDFHGFTEISSGRFLYWNNR
jgi:hypothetical protein